MRTTGARRHHGRMTAPLVPPFNFETATAKVRAGNDIAITDAERRFHWDNRGPRPANHPGLSELGL